ncbi:MAG: sn-glycerol-3-phosphate ABC transporter ATP-binding protein UgpC [Desulfobacterales bacterium]|nr:sn-glycerol-3-phosphate ABC transporter ATP-binding protein UgpC [Desulfobacterales bacterium]
MGEIVITGLNKTYPNGVVALQDFDLAVADGEFLVLVGPSGCGKSTVLRCVAGLERPTSGTITVGGRVVNDLPPQERDLAMVFQTYALYPHMTVFENLAFSLKMRRRSQEEIRGAVASVAEKLGLGQHLHKKPRELSGGERQRVALGRAIVRAPQAFLMDEPLSNLDAALRVQMRIELLKVQRELQATVLYVTHDQTEALTMGDRVAVLHSGRLQQVAPPREIYDRPANRFVAGFIGSPAMNFVTARITRGENGLFLDFGGQTLSLPTDYLQKRPGLKPYQQKNLIAGLRPEHFIPASEAKTAAPGILKIRVEVVETVGPVNYVHFSLPDPQSGRDRTPFVAALDPSVPATPAQDLEVAIDPDRIHFFDPETGTTTPY